MPRTCSASARGRHAGAGAARAMVLLGAAVLAGSLLGPPAAEAHPNCVVAQPYGSVSRAFSHVVRATPTISTRSRSDARWVGTMTLNNLRFIRWPKKEPRPVSVSIDFDYSPDNGCTWYPDLYHEYFVLDGSPGHFVMVVSYERRH